MSKRHSLTTALTTLAVLVRSFPKTFVVDDSKRIRPLAIGIRDTLFAHGDALGLSRTRIRRALDLYTQSSSYLRSLSRGGHRVDLLGKPAGIVSETHKARAIKLLRRIRQQQLRNLTTDKYPSGQFQ